MQKGGRGSLTKYNGKVQIGGTHAFGIKNLPCLCPSSVQVCKPRPTLLTTLPVLPATYSLFPNTADKSTQCFRCMRNAQHVSIIIIYTNKGTEYLEAKCSEQPCRHCFVFFFLFWSWTFCFFSTPSWRYFQDVTKMSHCLWVVPNLTYKTYTLWIHENLHLECKVHDFISSTKKGVSLFTPHIHLNAFNVLDHQIKRVRRNLA